MLWHGAAAPHYPSTTSAALVLVQPVCLLHLSIVSFWPTFSACFYYLISVSTLRGGTALGREFERTRHRHATRGARCLTSRPEVRATCLGEAYTRALYKVYMVRWIMQGRVRLQEHRHRVVRDYGAFFQLNSRVLCPSCRYLAAGRVSHPRNCSLSYSRCHRAGDVDATFFSLPVSLSLAATPSSAPLCLR